MKTPKQTEGWAIDILSRFRPGQPLEDSLVELKRELGQPVGIARHLAGHANAARGADILWLFGVDEKEGVVGVDQVDFASWAKQLESHFDGECPRPTEVRIGDERGPVLAVAFDTSRPPYVVMNEAFGKQKGEKNQFEVPWRDRTFIRTASRREILSILSELDALPEIEVIAGNIRGWSNVPGIPWYWHVDLDLFIVPHVGTEMVIPIHQCRMSFSIPGVVEDVQLAEVRFNSFGRDDLGQSSTSFFSTPSELVAIRPGRTTLTGNLKSQSQRPPDVGPKGARIRVLLRPVRTLSRIVIDATLDLMGDWAYGLEDARVFNEIVAT